MAKTEDIVINSSIEQTLKREMLVTKPPSNPNSPPLQQKNTDHPTELPAEKSKKHRLLFIALALVVLFTSMSLFALPVSAASYRAAHTLTNAAAHGAHAASNSANQAEASQALGLPFYCHLGPLSLIAKKCRKAPECAFIGLVGDLLDPRCTQGATGDGNPWSFPCSDKDDQGTVDVPTIEADWLSGDPSANPSTAPPAGNTTAGTSGNFFVTYASNTYNLPGMQELYPLMEGAGFALLSPVILLIGYQLIWASWTFGYARILGIFPQLLLSIIAIVTSYTLTQMLINLENVATTAVLALHTHFPFPPITINGHNVPLTLAGDKADSFRAIIMPMSRWGCQANDFVGLLESKFLTDTLGSILPFVGGLVKLAGTIKDGILLVKMLGPLILCVMSINLFAQVLFRIILLNYYILISPVVFACWALPGGVGQGVVRQWFKGFFALLFVQTFQVFVAATLPLILPSLPQLPWDGTHILESIMLQFPPIIVLSVINKVPKFMGTKATAAMAQAGSVASGAVVALAATAYQTV